ncbi:MAG TPA: ZIP family metal transporter [Gemmatimonadales bacterium]|jgi:ZIP family zinc transporter|nr:ZIP family metal transporter [Gemmatimonadales bacterium]
MMGFDSSYSELAPPLQALLAGLGTLALTAAGAALVILGRLGRGALFDAMLGFASGVMLAAAYWSLLEPAIAVAAARGDPPWLPATCGLLIGAIFLAVADRLLPHLHPTLPPSAAEGPRTAWSITTLLVLAITLHNIPEGLAVGVAFGAVGTPDHTGLPGAPSFGAAVALAMGIALQNIPEGAAVALPLRATGLGKWRSFLAGTASAAVEPVAAVAGAVAVGSVSAMLPYALAFAAGAMIYVVLEELIPSAHQSGRADLVTMSAVGGFTLMMVLDVALG